MHIVEVIWFDAVKEEAHIKIESATQLTSLLRKNVGYVVKETDEEITLTWGIIQNLYHDETALDGGFLIPRCMIKDIKILML